MKKHHGTAIGPNECPKVALPFKKRNDFRVKLGRKQQDKLSEIFILLCKRKDGFWENDKKRLQWQRMVKNTTNYRIAGYCDRCGVKMTFNDHYSMYDAPPFFPTLHVCNKCNNALRDEA